MGNEAPICSGTGCKLPSIGSVWELREVPAWRHPPDRLGVRAYEPVKLVTFCEEHERVARAASVIPATPQR